MSIDKSESRIRRMFGEISPRYDLMNHLLSGGVDYYWRWRTVRTVQLNGDAPVLDVCTGTGDLALAYWRAGRRSVPVVGTDFTHEMLVLADRKLAQQRPAPNETASPVAFLEADTQRLPFADDQFQIVSVAFGLRNVTNTEQGLREMVRVCRPGGKVVVLEFSMPTNRVLRAAYRWYFRHVLPRIGQLLARNRESAYNYLPASVSEFPQGEALGELFQHCGLTQVTWRPLTFGIATLYWGEKSAVRNGV
jgi:demethylmenaquinone methyltransferase/2-methoxy-6-polyprenyl-1,4-benzoquinol methylase